MKRAIVIRIVLATLLTTLAFWYDAEHDDIFSDYTTTEYILDVRFPGPFTFASST
jgi:hypothetical protein